MKRRELTPEEKRDAARLREVWAYYQDRNAGATQVWLAQETELGSQGAVSQYLRGVIPLNLDSLLAFSRVLEVRPDQISPALSGKILGAFPGADGGSENERKLLSVYRRLEQRDQLVVLRMAETIATEVESAQLKAG